MLVGTTPPLELDEAALIWESIISHVLSIQLGPFHNDVTNNTVVTSNMMIQIESFPPSLPNFLLLSKSQTKVKVRGVLT